MTPQQREKLKNGLAQAVGRILQTVFENFELRAAIKCKYEDEKGNIYRMTFEKIKDAGTGS